MKFFIATICTLLGCAFASPIELNPRGAEVRLPSFVAYILVSTPVRLRIQLTA
jgi:hypothetical protein